MILVTGAGGTVGSELVNQLEAANASFRAGYFSNEKADAARARGMDAAVIDYSRPGSLDAALQDCDRLFLLGPNVPNQVALETNVVTAANGAGVRHIVKQSVFRADEEAYTLGRVHRSVEKAIESSGIAWTFLRPNSFMQNVGTFMSGTISAQDAFYSASGDAKISHVDVRDIATVAVRALTGAGHEGKAYTLTGAEALTYGELADELSEALGRPISHISLAPEELKGGMLAEGLPEEIVDRLVDLERYFREGEASLVTSDIKEVTDRDPRRFHQYVREWARSL